MGRRPTRANLVSGIRCRGGRGCLPALPCGDKITMLHASHASSPSIEAKETFTPGLDANLEAGKAGEPPKEKPDRAPAVQHDPNL
jgi:hypothetical protein